MHSLAKIDGIEGIAFDLDGTLYPNYRFNLLLFPFILKELKLLIAFGRARNIIRKEQESPDFIHGFEDKGGFYKYQAELVAKLLKLPPKEESELQEKLDRVIYKAWEPMFKNVKLFKDAISTLSAFKSAGLKLGLMSDFPPKTKLEYLGLSKFENGSPIWDAALSSEECGALKPHPLPFIKLAAAMSLPPEKILYVGNSHSYDVAGAAKAGMKTAWIASKLPAGKRLKSPKADFIFNNYRQLLKIVLK